MKAFILILSTLLIFFSNITAQTPVLYVKIYHDTVMTSTFSDGLAVAFGNQYSNSVIVGEDATKLLNPGENLGVERDGNYLSIEKRKMPMVNDSIPIKMLGYAQGKYVLRFHSNNYSAITNVKLIMFDSYSETETEISPLSNQYVSFEVGSEAQSKSPTRFKLIYRDATAQTLPVTISNLSTEVRDNKTKLNWTMSNTQSLQWYEVERSANGSAFYSIFKADAASIKAENMSYTDCTPLNGTAYYRIKGTDQNGTVKYSAIVKVNMSRAADIKVYPNPVKNNTIRLLTSGLPEGNYTVELVNGIGQKLYVAKLVQQQSANAIIQLPKTILPGMYSLKLSSEHTTVTTRVILE